MSQLDRLADILDGEVEKKALRVVHNARLPSGKRTAPPIAAPISTVATGQFADPVDFTVGLKVGCRVVFSLSLPACLCRCRRPASRDCGHD